MTGFALALVLVAAVLHATWNLFAKRAGGGLGFVWLVGAAIGTFYVPVLIIYCILRHPTLTAQEAGWIAGSGALKTAYSLLLQRAYRSGDFSLTYPLARETGPLLSTAAAIAFLGERPTAIAIAGAALIVGAVFYMSGGVKVLHQDRAHLRPALFYGITTGAFIAAYTIWDRHGVAAFRIPPIVYDGGTTFVQLLLLAPFVPSRTAEIGRHWREHRRYVLGIAVLAPVGYVLVLTALTFTPVSYVAPAREVSIVIGAFLGARVLGESNGAKRIGAAVVVAIGVIALALG